MLINPCVEMDDAHQYDDCRRAGVQYAPIKGAATAEESRITQQIQYYQEWFTFYALTNCDREVLGGELLIIILIRCHHKCHHNKTCDIFIT